MARLQRVLMAVLVLCYLRACTAKPEVFHREGWESEMQQKMRAHQMEMEHLQKISSDKVSDWTIHTDVDDSHYWFSRSLKRSVREPPQGWTKDEKGKWKAPPRQRDEL
uniref:WW domain-containing protein n=1 Tax=Haptolina brevifila TaxID=156173 RepID=A0A7S2NBV4_9EUKA